MSGMSAAVALDLLQRSYTFDAVEAPAIVTESLRWVGTSLGIAGTPLLVGENEIEEIIETPRLTPIPGTKPWVLGVAAHKGGLLPVFSGDIFFRKKPYSGRVRDYCMVISRSGFYFGMTLSGIERDIRFAIEEREMKHPVDADFAEFTLGGFRCNGTFLAVLDIDKLVADPDLADASAAGFSGDEGKTDE